MDDNLILLNGHVITMNPAMAAADFVVVHGGMITEVGRGRPTLRGRKRRIETIDCGGKAIVPGFVDAHCHVVSYAETLVTLDLSPKDDLASLSDLKKKVSVLAAGRKPGTWVRGKRYDEFYLAERRHPNRWDLDAAAPNHPVRLSHRSGHAHVLNSLALRLAGITAETGDPPGGLIDRDLSSGEPTGLLFGMGGYLSERIPPLEEEEIERGLALASKRLLSYGVTSVCDASSHNGPVQWGHFEGWTGRGVFQPRVTMMTGPQVPGLPDDGVRSPTTAENRLRLGPVKIIVHRATGDMNPCQEELNTAVSVAHQAGRQVAIHAIEAEGVEAACDAIEAALERYPRIDHRHRIEHCSVCPTPLLDRMRRLGVFIVTQPSFIYHSGDRYLKTVSQEEKPYLYRAGSMVRAGVSVSAGSDFPVTEGNPLLGIYSAVTRKSAGGDLVLPEESVQPMVALEMHTRRAAKASREEHLKGAVMPGRLADLVVLSDDPTLVAPDEIKAITVVMTVLGGEVVWDRLRRRN